MNVTIIGFITVLVLGIGAQWLAWRFRLPSILLLLLLGFIAGPITGVLDPAMLQGDWVFAFVSISIGIILFEGGLSLRIDELRKVGKAVANLITIGTLFTWIAASAAAHFVAGLNIAMSIQIGAILTVTGPTVVIPLLRHVRPKGRVGTVARWEGITIDPVGAILSVLVLESIVSASRGFSTLDPSGGILAIMLHTVEELLLALSISVGLSVLGSAILVAMLYRRLVPDYLQSAVALMVVVGLFVLSNTLQSESGLLEVTLMGIIMANQKYVPVRRISEFKADLQVLLIGSLFVVLSARLDVQALQYIDTRALLFLAVLIVFVRPAAVFLSLYGTAMSWREKAFLSWLAPRGIVAAAVASLFAFDLAPLYPEASEQLVPLVFLVIVGTVAIYGLTISPVSRLLGLAEPDPQGMIILGAHGWGRQIARRIQELGFKVLLVDSNVKNIEIARQRGLHATHINVLDESAIDELELGGVGRFLAMTSNDEVNALASLRFSDVFDSNAVYQLDAREDRPRATDGHRSHLRGRPLFGAGVTFAAVSQMILDGAEIRTVEIAEDTKFDDLIARYGPEIVMLFVVRGNQLIVHSESEFATAPGDNVILVAPLADRTDIEAATEKLAVDASVIDLPTVVPFDEILTKAAAKLALRLPVTVEQLKHGFHEVARLGAMPVEHGVALIHYRGVMIEHPELVVVRCQAGLNIIFEDDNTTKRPVYAVFFLASPEEHPARHLRVLAHLADRIDDPAFIDAWRAAAGDQALKEALLRPGRYSIMTVGSADDEIGLAGQAIDMVEIGTGSRIVLVGREDSCYAPEPSTVLRNGDRLTIVGLK